jgi:hypothetical protein
MSSEGITALGAALVVGGAGALLAAIGPAGWFVLGIGGLATAFAALSGYKDKMFKDLEPVTCGQFAVGTKIKNDPLQLGGRPPGLRRRH